MKQFVYPPVDIRRTVAVGGAAFVASLAISRMQDPSGGTIFLFGWLMFALGWACVFAQRRQTEREMLAWDAYEESDWRHFDVLRELTGAELDDLRMISKSVGQREKALDWLVGRLELSRDHALRVHDFFIKSGWAHRGDISEDWYPPYAADDQPELQKS